MRQLAILVVILLIAGGLLVYSQLRTEPAKVSGFVEADEIRVGSRVGGRILKVHVVEGQWVAEGMKLIELAPFDLLERQAEAKATREARAAEYERFRRGFREEEVAAKARHDQLVAQLEKLRAGPRPQEIKIAQAELDAAKAQLALAEQNFKRTQEVYQRGVATQQDMDKATQELRSAQAVLEAKTQQLDLLREGTRREDIAQAEAQVAEALQDWKLREAGYRAEEIEQAKAARDAAEAALRVIERQIDELTIVAPTDGVVQVLDLEPGDLVTANAPVLTILDLRDKWVQAYVPLNRYLVEPGQTLQITVDTFPGESFQGKVSYVSREAEFTPSNAQTPEDRAKLVYRIKVQLGPDAEQLLPGMSCDVWLEETMNDE